jgi:predicted MPP superfamily phosphohydrolase
MRAVAMAVFLLVVTSVTVGVHRYLWARLVRDPGWSAPWTRRGTRALIGLGALLPVGMMLNRALPRSVASPVAWVVFLWMGTAFLLFVSVLAGDVLRLAARTADPDRRTFLARALATVTGSLGAALSGVAVGTALAAWTVRTVPVRLAKLPASKRGFTIVQLTDVHVGPTIGRDFIEALVARVNALSPDLVAITGDLVDGSVATLGPLLEPLRNLRAPHGVFFVTGNHEYISGVEEWVTFLPSLGIRVLENERVTIGEGDDAFELAGVYDFSAARFRSRRVPDLAGALRGWTGDTALVLLAHQPKHAREAAARGVGLVLSGHTHGGQIWPFSYLVRLDQPYIAGLHRERETQVYVSEGTGYWGPPMRLGTRGEITRVVLQPA